MAPQHEPYSNCPSAGRIVTGVLLSFLALVGPITASLKKPAVLEDIGSLDELPIVGPGPVYSTPGNPVSYEKTHRFTLRNIFHHGTYLHPKLHRRKDVSAKDTSLWRQAEDGFVIAQDSAPIVARSMSTKIERLVDRRPSVVDPMVAVAREQGEVWTLSPSAWTVDDVPGPNITDKETIIALARMAANAYIEVPFTEDWEDIHDGGFDSGAHFGWQGDGLRGHVFTDEDNSTIVISLKGTSLALWDGAETTTNDKENDNLFFSCCCAQQGQLTWRKVCDCASATYTCNNTCLVGSLRKENRYYQAALDLYSNITALYPNSNVWVTGHSLGGAVSSLLGMTYGLPTVTFEAPGEALAAKRLGLPAPPGADLNTPQIRENTGVYHFGHTADPIYLGVCNGATGSCTYYGYAMETACHSGYECVYDVTTDKGWRVGIGTHRIHIVIDDVIKKYETVPQCVLTPECTDCALWKYYESNSSDSTTTSTSTSSKTRTRTATCQTPGWWGCLDETTTTTTTTSSTTTNQITTTTSSTSTCKTPGWFGCYDKTTSTTTTTSTSGVFTPTSTKSFSAPTTSCQSPGFWGGCNDPTTTSPPSSTSTIGCETPGLFWGCKDKTTSSTISHPITSPPTLPSGTAIPSATKHRNCTSKAWFGLVCADPSPTSAIANTPFPMGGPRRQQQCSRRSWFGYCKQWEDISGNPSQEI